MVLFYAFFAALAGSAAYVGQMLSPRMLVYKLRIGGLPRISRAACTGGYNLALSAGVELMNDNLVHLDVHAISFDFYAPNGKRGASHLGTVKNLADTTAAACKQVATTTTPSSSPAFWSVSGQSKFRTQSRMNLSLKIVPVLRSLWRFTRRFLRHGFIEIPTTGVAHVKAAAASNYTAMPFTLSIACDNRVDLTWRGLDITGKTCEMKTMVPGWNDLNELASSMRQVQVSQA